MPVHTKAYSMVLTQIVVSVVKLLVKMSTTTQSILTIITVSVVIATSILTVRLQVKWYTTMSLLRYG